MRSRIRFAAAALAAFTVIGVMTSNAGAAVNQWNVQANAGFVKLTLLGNQVQLAGGTSEADANSASVANAMGTGICIAHGGANCPTSTTSDLTAPDKTTTAVATASGKGTNQSAAPSCLTPSIDAQIVGVNVSCGNASASEDASGNPTASGNGAVANIQVDLPVNGLSSSACSATPAPAATPGPANDVSQLTQPVQSLLGTVNQALASLPVPAPPLTDVANPSSQSGSSCSVLEGLLGPLDAAIPSGAAPVKTLLDTLVSAGGHTSSIPPLLNVTAAGSKSSVSHSTNSAGDPIVTGSASTGSLDVNVMGGMLDLTVTPTVNTVTFDQATGQASTHCDVGLISIDAGGTDQFVSLLPLGSAIQTLLTDLDQTPLAQLLSALIGAPPAQNPDVLSCSPTGDQNGASVSQTGGDVSGLHVLPAGPLAPDGLIGLDLGTTTVSASSTSATVPGVTTTPSQGGPTATPAANPVPAPVPAAAPAAVPNVTSVHTGEFWSGTLPIILMVGMALLGSLLIGRRRVVAFARNLPLISRRWGSH